MTSKLEQAKQAYLVLSASERKQFESFMAKHRQDKHHSRRIVLRDGGGKRACYNGKTGIVVEGSKRSGGWIDVRVGRDTVSWRSGNWDEEMEQLDVVDLDPRTLALPTDALALVLGRVALPTRLRAMSVSTAWAALTEVPDVWASLVTPLDATDFNAARLSKLLMRSHELQVLDVGVDAGRHTADSVLNLTLAQAAHPMHTTLCSLAQQGRLKSLHTLRFRYSMPWVSERLLITVLQSCLQLRHLQLPKDSRFHLDRLPVNLTP